MIWITRQNKESIVILGYYINKYNKNKYTSDRFSEKVCAVYASSSSDQAIKLSRQSKAIYTGKQRQASLWKASERKRIIRPSDLDRIRICLIKQVQAVEERFPVEWLLVQLRLRGGLGSVPIEQQLRIVLLPVPQPPVKTSKHDFKHN